MENAYDMILNAERNSTTSGIDAQLSEIPPAPGGEIAGTVTDGDNNPLQGIEVQAYRYMKMTGIGGGSRWNADRQHADR